MLTRAGSSHLPSRCSCRHCQAFALCDAWGHRAGQAHSCTTVTGFSFFSSFRGQSSALAKLPEGSQPAPPRAQQEGSLRAGESGKS